MKICTSNLAKATSRTASSVRSIAVHLPVNDYGIRGRERIWSLGETVSVMLADRLAKRGMGVRAAIAAATALMAPAQELLLDDDAQLYALLARPTEPTAQLVLTLAATAAEAIDQADKIPFAIFLNLRLELAEILTTLKAVSEDAAQLTMAALPAAGRA